jgi:hypothetical protein
VIRKQDKDATHGDRVVKNWYRGRRIRKDG